MKVLKHRPLIRNAIPPWEMFNASEMRLITEGVKRSIALGRYGAKPKVAEKEIEAVKVLFDKAAFNGYLHSGIDDNGNARWAVICEPENQKMKDHMVVATIKRCAECNKQFQAWYFWKADPRYPNTEIPPDLCMKCGIKARDDEKKHLAQKQDDIPF